VNLVDRFNALPPGGIDPADALVLRRGHARDYASLARFHYRTAAPATIVDVLALIDAQGEAAACLVISRPTLNSWWRALAWPDLARRNRREAALALNESVRTISRVIVDPRYRAIGLAVRLVRMYLREPITPRTEAVAAMGRACPFFARAGMTGHHRSRSARDRTLLRTLSTMGLTPASLLNPPRRARRALRAWANDARATRHLDDSAIARAAARAIFAPPMAYTHGPPIRGPAARGDPWSSSSTRSATPMTCTRSSSGTSA
jgi:GNAT superfamily N-acetyltransferase